MKKKYFLFCIVLLSVKISVSQTVQLSTFSKISIVTVGPGKKLYEKFGHSAIRVKDPVLGLDLIYNYGIFDFNAPNFYTNFFKGKLIYKLVGYPFRYFKEDYTRDKRWVKEQVLNLTEQERQQFFMYLYNNAKPENANYLYDPFFNNCATKMRDVTTSILGDKVTFSTDFVKQNKSLRQLMNQEVYWNTWGGLGLNLISGCKLDKKVEAMAYMFLPKYVYESFKNATVFIENQPKKLVKESRTILDFKEPPLKSDTISPLLIFTVLLVLGLFFTYRDYKNKKETVWFDFLLFFLTGIVGVIVVFMWFFTSHSATPNNLNFLWAFAPNVVVGFLLFKKNKPQWLQKYIGLLLIMLVAMILIWILKIQVFSWCLLPIYALLLIRYLFLFKSKALIN
ncbi:DUF4105 domain-containing protein [Tenacibaculum sp. UWU-22]|uniref:lipoprotein N-acyltransferase Lnb domain-containing protein n=1 Tax=Tenacibaculum sp. UWU-22 TaxID=3234187 RepID=UPI0034DB3D9B